MKIIEYEVDSVAHEALETLKRCDSITASPRVV
jgi:hypothetical protein